MRFRIENYDDAAMEAIVYLEVAADAATYTNKTLSEGQVLLVLADLLRRDELVRRTSPPDPLSVYREGELGGDDGE